MPRNAKPLLPFVKRVMSKGKEYLYFDTGKREHGKPVYIRLPNRGDPALGGAHASAMAGRTRRANLADRLTVPALWKLYEASWKHRKDLAEGSKRLYHRSLEKLSEMVPTAPANELDAIDLREVMELMVSTPSMANAVIRSTGAMYAWGRKMGHVTNDPVKGVEYYPEGEHKPWSEDALKAGLACKDDQIRLLVHCLYYGAQRLGDTSRLRWSDLNGAWTLTQEKTDKTVTVPIHRLWAAEIARHRPQGPFLFANPNGKLPTVNALRMRMQKTMAALGHKIVPHGLRKNAVNALLEAGCSVAETTAITGQTLEVVEHYAKERDTRALGRAAILRWEQKA